MNQEPSPRRGRNRFALPSPLRRGAVALALAAVLYPGGAFADEAREAALEARIAELERLVSQLVSQQAETTSAQQAIQAEVAEVKAKPAGQSKPIIASGSDFSYGGFIKFDAMVTDTSDGQIADGSAGRMFYVPSTIPVAADGAEPDVDPYTDFGAQFSRFWFAATHTTEAGDSFRGFIEADLFGGGSGNLGNEVSTNTHAVTIRHAFVSWNNWLAGQTWSNFQDTAALVDSVDFVGVTDGTTFVRQAQVRYTNGPWSFSLENPKTTVTNYLGAGRHNANDGVLPDLTARWTHKGDWGHFSVAGLLRQLHDGDESASGGAVSVSGKFNLGSSDDIRYMVNYGKGFGRYFAFGQGTDAITDIDGDIEALTAYSGFVGWRHVFSPKLRGNLAYSAAFYDNDADLTGWSVTERSHSLRANLIYSPFPRLDVGAEISYGERALEDSREGDMRRLAFTAKYSF
ncbi:MAG: DcaP family trimeric outer membrane transporter [Lysobacteraceae bacterium]